MIRAALEEKKRRGSKKMGVEEGCLTDHLADSTEDVKLIRDEVRLHDGPLPPASSS